MSWGELAVHVVEDGRVDGLPMWQQLARKAVKHNKIVASVDIALAICAGGCCRSLRQDAAHGVGRVAPTVRGEENFLAIAGALVHRVALQSGRAGQGGPVEKMLVDRFQPAGHVARHRALGDLKKDQRFWVVDVVEEGTGAVGVTLHAGPCEVEIGAFGPTRAALLKETDKV